MSIRWTEWGDSKLPFIILAFLLATLKETGRNIDYSTLLGTLGFCCCYLAFGYLYNDWMDREADRIVGKVKPVQQWPAWKALGLLFIIVVVSVLFILPWINRISVLVIIGLCYLFAITYSGPFLRFKERGWLGLLVASLAQRTLPVSLVYAVLRMWDASAIIYLVLTLLVGLRWIVTHQVDDLDRDRTTFTKTFATSLSRKQLDQLLIKIFNLEIFSLLLLAVSIPSSALFWIYAIYILFSCIFSIATQSTPWQMLKTPATAYLVLADLYFLYWPLGIMVWLGIKQYPYWWFLNFLTVLLLYRHIKQHLFDISWLYRHFMKGLS